MKPSAAELLQAISQAGGHVTADGGDLVLKATRPLPDDLLAEVKARKPEILVALQEITDQTEDLAEYFNERAAILEYDGGLPRAEAELEAARITATYARNAGYSWASLRMALSAYPELLAALPDSAGTVDSLPFGVAVVMVLAGKRVVRQGAYSIQPTRTGTGCSRPTKPLT